MTASGLSALEPLSDAHHTAAFHSGADELDEWLRRYALANQHAGNARTYVTSGGPRVVGYYALATASVERVAFPSAIAKGGVPSQVPCLLLARLAVDLDVQGLGIGRGLLVDALRRAIRVGNEVGVRALLIHARDDAARAWYTSLGEFVASPTDSLHLFLHLKHARLLLR